MIVLVHEKHDKWPNVSPVEHLCSGLDHAKLESFFRGSNFYQKLDSVYYYKYEHFKRFVREDDNVFSPKSGRLGIGHIF